MRGDGYPYQRHAAGCQNRGAKKSEQACSCQWWIRYSFRGKDVRESAGPKARTERDAKRKVRDRINSIRGDRYIGPHEDRLTIGDLLDALETHLKTRGASLRSSTPHVKVARAHFGMERAVGLTATRVERFQAEELAAETPRAPATINRIVGTLRQAFRLARKHERISRVPYFPMLKEENVRQGFIEPKTFEKVAAATESSSATSASAGPWRAQPPRCRR